MKSAELETFPCHITLPNACQFFGDKKWVTAKRFATLWDYFGNRASNLFQNEKKPLRRLKV